MSIPTTYDVAADHGADAFDPIAWFEGTGEDRGLPPGWLDDYNARLAAAKARLLTTKVYDPAQPRVPAGSPEGGEFASAGGASADPMSPEVSAAVHSWTGRWFDDDINRPYVVDNHSTIRTALAKDYEPSGPQYVADGKGPAERFAERRAEGEALLRGINGSPPTSAPLYRGVRMTNEDFNRIVGLQPGDTIDMNVSSWSTEKTAADQYAGRLATYTLPWQKAPEGLDNPVVFTLDAGAKALDVAGRTPLKWEHEYLTAGRFTVKDVYDRMPDGVYVALTQTATFDTAAQTRGTKGAQ